MTLRLHDTAARAVRDFVPLVPGKASVYLCGATVQAPPHIGHIRSGVVFDILVRWLRASGYQVTFCRNVTDIDDKIIRVAGDEGVAWWAVAERNQRAFTRAYDALGCLPPDVEPRATGHVPEMIVLMRRLIDGGHAYAAGGDVYFDVLSYGQLRRAVRPAARPHARRPRTSRTGPSATRATSRCGRAPSPASRPGRRRGARAARAGTWSARRCRPSTSAPTFDIHGGGLDLVFPHHENELAQSHAAGDGFARYWVHNGLLGLSGEKMSKSLGNSLLVDVMVTKVRPAELRYYLGQAHYRSELDYSPEALAEAAAAYRRIENFVIRAAEASGSGGQDGTGLDPGALTATALPAAFTAAMDDDLGVPKALAVVHEAVTEGNSALAAGDRAGAAKQAANVRAMMAVLGLDPLDEHWAGGGSGLSSVVDALVTVALGQRQAARERKDWAAADAIRDQLLAAGIVVEDTPGGSRWELRR